MSDGMGYRESAHLMFFEIYALLMNTVFLFAYFFVYNLHIAVTSSIFNTRFHLDCLIYAIFVVVSCHWNDCHNRQADGMQLIIVYM